MKDSVGSQNARIGVNRSVWPKQAAQSAQQLCELKDTNNFALKNNYDPQKNHHFIYSPLHRPFWDKCDNESGIGVQKHENKRSVLSVWVIFGFFMEDGFVWRHNVNQHKISGSPWFTIYDTKLASDTMIIQNSVVNKL